jgi:transcriptional regulator with PAS, ATPase and Fis domain
VTQPIVGDSAHTRQLLQLIRSIAPTAASVLINGESGAGKELIAKAIHDQSDRLGQSFVAVNCGAIPSELMESELFGHKKGSFTGAIADHVGKVTQADGGTLFLDEIGDMPMSMQVKLLRVLQEKIVLPVGSNSLSTSTYVLLPPPTAC